MKIITPGIVKPKKPKKFICAHCECVFELTDKEITKAYNAHLILQKIKCPQKGCDADVLINA